jgi:mannose-6-phosphate isomerase-like protein (cupin superfamily)
VDVFFFIISGTGEVEIGEERETVNAGSIIESPKDIIHGLHNTSKELFEVLVVKTPKP